MTKDSWKPDYFHESPLFELLIQPATVLSSGHHHDWPGLDEYQQLFTSLNGQLLNRAGCSIRFVSQGLSANRFEEGYEPRIYLNGEIQTRVNNWHDYFQVLVWCLFPQLKLSLNALHYREALQRLQTSPQKTNRSPVENALTLFDECGVILISDDIELLELIRDFRWKHLFWHHRQKLERHLSCLVFGHALYEKAISPYIGMTGQAILLKCPTAFLALPAARRIAQLDRDLASFFNGDTRNDSFDTGALTPFPLLGVPGWDDNNNADYYNNSDYFRPGRNKAAAPIFDLARLGNKLSA